SVSLRRPRRRSTGPLRPRSRRATLRPPRRRSSRPRSPALETPTGRRDLAPTGQDRDVTHDDPRDGTEPTQPIAPSQPTTPPPTWVPPAAQTPPPPNPWGGYPPPPLTQPLPYPAYPHPGTQRGRVPGWIGPVA